MLKRWIKALREKMQTKETVTALTIRERDIRLHNRLKQQSFDYQEFIKRKMQEDHCENRMKK